MTRSHLMLLLRLVCGGLLLWWALHKAELGDWRQLPLWSLHSGWVLLAMCLGGLSVVGWSLRWRIFLKITGLEIDHKEALRLTLFADFFNLYFLGPLGADGVRALFLNQRFPGKKLAILHSILLDHASGLLGGVLLYGCFTRPQSAWLTQGDGMVRKVALMGADIFLGVLGFMTISAVAAILVKGIWNALDSRKHIRVSLHPLRPFLYLREHKMELLSGQLVSILSLLCGYAAYWAAGHAVGEPVPALRILGIMPMVDAISALPVTISGLGVRENLFVELLGQTLPSKAQEALAVSLLGFAAIGIWGLVGGVWLALHRWRSRAQPAREAPNIAP